MKTLFASLALLFVVQAIAEDTPKLAAVQAADKARVAAMQSPDRDKLGAIFSDELRYAHSNGIVDSKTSFIESLMAGKTKYVGYDYEEQNFTFASLGIALMTGRAKLKIEGESGIIEPTLIFLGVWREEQGQWKFLAWQSCKLASPTK